MTGKGITRYGWRLLSNREKGGMRYGYIKMYPID